MSKVIRDCKGRATLRSRSLDCVGDCSSPEADKDEQAVSGQRFVVLADYMALTSQEIEHNEILTIYTSFNHSQDRRPAESSKLCFICWKKIYMVENSSYQLQANTVVLVGLY